MSSTRSAARADAGVALVLALLFTVLLLLLATGLILVASIERAIAANYEAGLETQYAADAIAELAVHGLSTTSDWSAVLSGVMVSPWTDGPSGGTRSLSDATPLNLNQVVNIADCGKSASCSTADMNAVTTARPWGPNNPRWQLFAYGTLGDLVPAAVPASRVYVVALVGDDGRENDGDPLKDGTTDDNPGCGILNILGEAFGGRGAASAVQVTVARVCDDMVSENPARVIAWREIP
jgi:hypothetical protein